MLNWIKFKDKEPKHGQDCLCIMKHGIVQGMWDAKDRVFSIYLWKDIDFFADFWIPLEEINTPKEEDR